MKSGILLLSKPSGPSSNGVLGPLKRTFNTRKIGHTGTLDPFASGLLILMVGKATRLAPFFTALDKEYHAVVKFGEQTDTLDPEGAVTESAPVPDPQTVASVLTQFTGTIHQTPPAFSALHVNGERAYVRARRGETVEIPARTVHIHELALEQIDEERYEMVVRCGSGTYIRALARDIAHAAGSVASLETLRRSAVGSFRDQEAVTPETLRNSPRPEDHLLSISEAVRTLGTIQQCLVAPELRTLISTGTKLDSPELRPVRDELDLLRNGVSDSEIVLLVGENNVELALCEHTESGWSYRMVFPW